MRIIKALLLAGLSFTAACTSGGFERSDDDPFAPGIAGESHIDGLIVGHRLMAASQFELALNAYTRAAAQQGLNPDTMSALGSANLRLGRLGQAERWLRRATQDAPNFAPAWNNLGVVLMERGKTAEASEAFRHAFATDNGNSDQIRDNLRAALAKLNDPFYAESQENQQFELVRRGTGDFLLEAPL